MMSDIGTGAAGGSTYHEAAPADVTAAGGGLADTSAAVRGGRSYGAVSGVGDYTVVAEAVAAQVEVWNPALDLWQESLSSLASAAKESAAAIETTDANLGRTWQRSASAMGGGR